MHVSSRFLARVGAIVALMVVAGVAVSGCSTLGNSTSTVTPKHEILYRELQTYPDIRVDANLTYETVGSTALKLDICLPNTTKGATISPRPAIVSLHGGSWAHGDKSEVDWRSICQWLASDGYIGASVDYRLAPENVYPDAIRDVEHAVEWLRRPAVDKRFAIDPTKIGVFGGSAGGNLASLLGTLGEGPLTSGHRVAAVAELSGPANLTSTGAELPAFYPYVESYLGCVTLASCVPARAASPLFHVDSSDPPFFIGHSLDERIPLVQSTKFVAALRAAGDTVTFVEVAGHEHSIAMLDAGMRARITRFYRATLGNPED
jgi:acetyl esterase